MQHQLNGVDVRTPYALDDQLIVDKLRRVFGGADEAATAANERFMRASHSTPEAAGARSLGDFERDCCDWGAVYGFAYALVREDSNAWHTPDTIADRALRIARALWTEWAIGATEHHKVDGFHDRDLNPHVQAVVEAYAGIANDRDRLPHRYVQLENALIHLSNAAGS